MRHAKKKAGDHVDWDGLVYEGRTDAEIGREVGRSRQAVRKQRGLRGIPAYGPAPEVETPAADAPIRDVVGWRIRLHRLRHSWSLERFSDEVGGSWRGTNIGAVEHNRAGQRGLSVPWVGRIAAALEVTPADLLLRPGQLELLAPPPRVRASGWSKLAKAWPERLREVLGLNIERWRLHRDLSPRALGDMLPVPRSATRIGLVERAEYGLTLEGVEMFAGTLGCSPADLVRVPRQPALRPLK